jgi:hypothetical protein
MKLKIIRQANIDFEDYCKIFYNKPSRKLHIEELSEARYEFVKFITYMMKIGALE